MMYKALSLTLFLVTLERGQAGVTCGIRPKCPNELTTNKSHGKKLVKALPTQFPWLAQLNDLGKGTSNCSATIISERTLLTAKQCIKRGSRYSVSVGTNSYYSGNPSTRNGTIYAVTSIKHHSADLAVLKTKKDMTFNTHTHPICVPTETQCYDLAGRRQGTKPSASKSTRVAFWPYDSNAAAFKSLHYAHPLRFKANLENDTDIILGDQSGKITDSGCNEASGAPLMITDNGQWFLYGITTEVVGRCKEIFRAGKFVRMSSYVNWIDSTVSGWDSKISFHDDQRTYSSLIKRWPEDPNNTVCRDTVCSEGDCLVGKSTEFRISEDCKKRSTKGRDTNGDNKPTCDIFCRFVKFMKNLIGL